MKLRDLPDLELAALVAVLSEAAWAAMAAFDFGAALAVNAARARAAREVLARRGDGAAADELFWKPVDRDSFAEVRRLVEAACRQLDERRFADASAMLRDRIGTELRIAAPAALDVN